MKDIFIKLKEKLVPLVDYINNPSIKRAARISYQVIWNNLLIFLITAVIGLAFAGGVGAGYFASMVKDEPIRSEKQLVSSVSNYEETSEIYFASNVYLGKMRSDLERKEVKLGDISDHVKKALISTEDSLFYEHQGVVPKAIIRALLQEVTNASVQSGGSTLTQQLVKQQILTNEVSFDRKAKEILLALRLEKFMTKDEILEAYLNISPFGRNSSGRNIAGVQAAAEGIFGVDAKDLNLPQAAFIAGLPQNPYTYTPFTQAGEVKKDLSPGLNRMKTVLNRMYSNGAITKKEYDSALKYDIKKHFAKKQTYPTEKYPFLTYEVEKRAIEIMMPILAKEDGLSSEDLAKDDNLYMQYYTLADQAIRQNGYQIHTTINKKMYDNMQNVTDNFPYYQGTRQVEKKDPDTGETYIANEPIEVGAMLIENSSGKILSFVGGRDFEREQLNHATASVRSNGSTMKPLLVYAPAMEYGVSYPGKTLVNAPVNINGWPPKNYAGGGITGITTAREALKRSYNIPAAVQYMEIINRNPVTYLEKMGFTSLQKEDYTNPSMSLGALAKGVTVEENTNAFATFANGGQFVDSYMIEKIVDSNGKAVYQHKAAKKDVFSPQTAYLTIDMMRDVINSGTAAGLNSKLRFSADWAGKTGTSQNFKDAWMVATNPNVTFGVWMGYDSNGSVSTSGMSYSQRNQSLWAQLINSAYEVSPDVIGPSKRHQMPGGIVTRSYCTLTGTLASKSCIDSGHAKSDYFNAKYLPSSENGNLSTSSERYVMINGKKYVALGSTPEEFTETGLVINADFSKITGAKYLIDKSSISLKGSSNEESITVSAKMSDNGKTPGAPSASSKEKVISWKSPGDSDIIGYRVYRINGASSSKVASIKANSSLSYKTDGNGIYYITAVDIAGNESAPSSTIEFKQEAKDQEDKKDKPKEKPKDKPKDKPEDKKKPNEESNAVEEQDSEENTEEE